MQTGDNGMPDRYLVTQVITKDVKNEDLRDFLQESIEECFQILYNGKLINGLSRTYVTMYLSIFKFSRIKSTYFLILFQKTCKTSAIFQRTSCFVYLRKAEPTVTTGKTTSKSNLYNHLPSFPIMKAFMNGTFYNKIKE